MKHYQYDGIFLGTGTNMGDRLNNLRTANQFIEQQVGSILQASAVYETEAWGITDQPSFYNQVLLVETKLDPEALLDAILDIEIQMGRIRIEKWGSRLIDIDLLFYDQLKIHSSKLILPHPFIAERNFVLAPLAELAPVFFHPTLKKTMQELLTDSKDPLKCFPINVKTRPDI